MPLLPEQPINVKSLVLEAPERRQEFVFDPQRDLKQEDWDFMRKHQNERKVFEKKYREDAFKFPRYCAGLYAMCTPPGTDILSRERGRGTTAQSVPPLPIIV